MPVSGLTDQAWARCSQAGADPSDDSGLTEETGHVPGITIGVWASAVDGCVWAAGFANIAK